MLSRELAAVCYSRLEFLLKNLNMLKVCLEDTSVL